MLVPFLPDSDSPFAIARTTQPDEECVGWTCEQMGGAAFVLHVFYIPVRKTKLQRARRGTTACKLVFYMRWGKQRRGFWATEGVGESGNEPAGTVKERQISTGVEMHEVKQGMCSTEGIPWDPRILSKVIRGWKPYFQTKRGQYFHRKH